MVTVVLPARSEIDAGVGCGPLVGPGDDAVVDDATALAVTLTPPVAFGGQSKQFMFTVRDEFNAVGYDGNDGSTMWSGNWTELGESDGPAAGVLQVSDAGAMRIGAKGSAGQFNGSLTRQADLTGATTVTLTFDYAVERGNSGTTAFLRRKLIR